jgi:hypothetical protein
MTGNGPTTQSDGPGVEEQSVIPNPTPSPEAPVPPEAPAASARHFPQTLVAMDPPTLPAARPTGPPPEFRQFPTPQRSVPGHPTMRRRLRRILMFWRRGA